MEEIKNIFVKEAVKKVEKFSHVEAETLDYSFLYHGVSFLHLLMLFLDKLNNKLIN